MTKKKQQKTLKEMQESITTFLEENSMSVFQVREEYITSQEIGKAVGLSALKTNKFLEEKGFLNRNEDKSLKLTEKSQSFGFTPVKFVTTIRGNNLITHLKRENPRWFSSFKDTFSKLVEEDKESKNGK